MKLYVEGVITTYVEDVFTLDGEEENEYRELATDEARQAWLEDLARELAWDAIRYDRELQSVEWRVAEETP